MAVLHRLLICSLFSLSIWADKYCCGCPDNNTCERTCESPGWCGGECGVVYCGTAGSCSGCATHYYDGNHIHCPGNAASLNLRSPEYSEKTGDVSFGFDKRGWRKLLKNTRSDVSKQIGTQIRAAKNSEKVQVKLPYAGWQLLLKDIESVRTRK